VDWKVLLLPCIQLATDRRKRLTRLVECLWMPRYILDTNISLLVAMLLH